VNSATRLDCARGAFAHLGGRPDGTSFERSPGKVSDPLALRVGRLLRLLSIRRWLTVICAALNA